MAQLVCSTAFAPPCHVETTQPSGRYCGAASAAFSPSTISTGALGADATISLLYSGRLGPKPEVIYFLPSQTIGRISLRLPSGSQRATAPKAEPSAIRYIHIESGSPPSAAFSFAGTSMGSGMGVTMLGVSVMSSALTAVRSILRMVHAQHLCESF